jgi:hypothetical protein
LSCHIACLKEIERRAFDDNQAGFFDIELANRNADISPLSYEP